MLDSPHSPDHTPPAFELMGTEEGLMTLLRTAFVAAFMTLAINVPVFAEDTSPSTGPTEAAMIGYSDMRSRAAMIALPISAVPTVRQFSCAMSAVR